jgi:AAHS family 3-hydroxyphenylpropionic acid transporter
MRNDATRVRSTLALRVALCFLVAVVEGFDLQVMSAIGPMVRGSLHLDLAQLGFVFSATIVGLGIGATVGGHVADRIGRKRIIVLSAAGMSVFALATIGAQGYWTLFLARLLTGLAIGGAMPNTIVMVEAAVDRSRSAGVVTLMLCGIPAGGIVAALASHGLVGVVGWRSVLVFGALFALLVAGAAQFGLPDLHRSAAARPVQRGFWTVLFGEGRAPATVLLWILSILSLAIVALLANWLPTLVVDKGLPASAGSSTLLAWNVGGVLGIVTVGRFCDWLGPRTTLLLSYCMEAALFVLFAKGSTASTLMAFAVVVNFFVAGSHYTIYGLSPRLYPADGAGAGVGTNMAMGRVGAVVGPAVAGLFLNAGSTGGQVILGLTPVALLCVLCFLALVASSRGQLGGSAGRGKAAAAAQASEPAKVRLN